MIHDQHLLDRLDALPVEPFDGIVYRATPGTRDPTAASSNGGRWSPVDVSVLYTSLERDGALAEVVSFWSLLSPLPSKPVRIHEIETATRRTLRLARTAFPAFGLDDDHYGLRDYDLTQRIGAALNFLGMDGLISPSARWNCENLTIFTENHPLDSKLNVRAHEDIPDWQGWARSNGFL